MRNKIEKEKKEQIAERIKIHPYFFLTRKQQILQRRKWEKAGYKKNDSYFFNPYRFSGIYFACLQAVYNLGENEWHSFADTLNEIKNILIICPKKGYKNAWEGFVFKDGLPGATKRKDPIGKIIHTYTNLQRINGKYPYGYKLKQTNSCIDSYIKDKVLYYKLNTTFKNMRDVKPLKLKG